MPTYIFALILLAQTSSNVGGASNSTLKVGSFETVEACTNAAKAATVPVQYPPQTGHGFLCVPEAISKPAPRPRR